MDGILTRWVSSGAPRPPRIFAKRNDVDPRDIRTRDTRDGVELEIRRSSLDRRGLKDSGEGRRDGWS